ncbi:MAG: DUF4142 domain-containing protein [Hyphomicrobiaceae bacterium]|nr:DUF4142 domain-containing protein [Hyphomicrobiaceae bacterium]
MLKHLIAILLIACSIPPASAQRASENAAAPAMSTGRFVREASAGNRFEIQSSQLALTRSPSPEVRTFARRMIADHRQADRQLRAAARAAGPTSQPATLDARHLRLLAAVRNARRPAFETTYIDSQVEAHVNAVALHRAYVRAGQNEQVRQAARQVLPVLEEHLRMAQRLDRSLTARR